MRIITSLAILVSIAILLCMAAVGVAIHFGMVTDLEIGRSALIGLSLVVVTFGANFVVLSASKIGIRCLASPTAKQISISLNVLLLLLSLLAARNMHFDGRQDLLPVVIFAIGASAVCALALLGELLYLSLDEDY